MDSDPIKWIEPGSNLDFSPTFWIENRLYPHKMDRNESNLDFDPTFRIGNGF